MPLDCSHMATEPRLSGLMFLMYRLAWPPSGALALALALSTSDFLAAAPALAPTDLARFAPPGRIVLVAGRQSISTARE